MEKVAVILSGCGRADGSEVSESVFTFLELSRNGIPYEIFAPDTSFDVVNHITGAPTGERRVVLIEAARIPGLQGSVTDIAKLDARNYRALVMPGGFGAAKNLSDIATNKKDPEIAPRVKACVVDCYKQGKPVVAICIAPALVSFCLAGKGISLTLGENDSGGMIAAAGNKHVACTGNNCVIDKEHKIITTPAFMTSSPLHEIHAGIAKAIEALNDML